MKRQRRITLAVAVAIGVAVFVAVTEGNALSLSDCDRVIHPSHGGETAHQDFGGGRVGYEIWWSQEGVFRDIIVADCRAGAALTTRAQEERISDRPPFDRRPAVRSLIEVEMAGAAALFSFDRLAASLKGTGRDIDVATLVSEPCACAVLYPDALGDKTPYEAGQ